MTRAEPRADGTRASGSTRRWSIVVRLCQVALAVLVAVGAWSIGFASDSGPTPVLPDTATQFSLDLTVVGTLDHPVVYVVEQRARPGYRIFAHDPATGEVTTIFTVPEDAIIYGIALSDDHSTLAVTYSPDFTLDGSGLWTLDVASGDMTMIADVEPGVYHADPFWTSDASAVLTTRVDRRRDDEQLTVGRISVPDGAVDIVASDAINPVAVDDDVVVLVIDDERARRRIGRVGSGAIETLASGDVDLDHLAVTDGGDLVVAAIESTESTSGLTFGSVAAAHGNHDRPSTWWTLPATAVDGAEPPEMSSTPSIIVYDAAAGDGTIVSVTNEGVSITDLESDIRHDLIESRAVRFIAA